MPTTGEIIKMAREDADMKQKELASLLGVIPNTVSKYENGNRIPDLDILIKIAKIFDISLDYLLGLSNSSVSTKYFDSEICKIEGLPVTYGDMIQTIKKLNPKSKLVILEHLKMVEIAEKYYKK